MKLSVVIWLKVCHRQHTGTGLAIVTSSFATKNPSVGKSAKEDLKQYYHHWFLGVSHQQPAILQNQQEDQVWSSKLHSSNDSSL